ncbi:hypothetical protein FQR65_LT15904 [Abscondita terminalis]|nr:hypothetical protein FQR65_LT15904 [Abscondita terminalis]
MVVKAKENIGEHHQTIHLIDWENWDNNDFGIAVRSNIKSKPLHQESPPQSPTDRRTSQMMEDPVLENAFSAGSRPNLPGEAIILAYIDRDSGEIIKVQVFVAVLPYSNYSFAMAVPSQHTDDFLFALGKCLEHLGGVPQVLVPDNLKAAVIKADKYEPVLNKVMEDFAEHYGLVVLPTRPMKPKDKPSVENTVRLIYQRVFARLRNQQFFSINELNTAIMDKVRAHNQTRMQREAVSREERFLADEKHLLKSLPERPFEKQYYAELTVSTNNCVFLAKG